MTGRILKNLMPLLLLFIALNAIFFAGNGLLERWNVNRSVLFGGNLLVFAITVISYFIARRGLKNPNPNAFVRSILGSMMVKLFVALIAATVYIAIHRSSLNKPGFFTCMGLYLVYTFFEVSALTKLLKGTPNA